MRPASQGVGEGVWADARHLEVESRCCVGTAGERNAQRAGWAGRCRAETLAKRRLCRGGVALTLQRCHPEGMQAWRRQIFQNSHGSWTWGFMSNLLIHEVNDQGALNRVVVFSPEQVIENPSGIRSGPCASGFPGLCRQALVSPLARSPANTKDSACVPAGLIPGPHSSRLSSSAGVIVGPWNRGLLAALQLNNLTPAACGALEGPRAPSLLPQSTFPRFTALNSYCLSWT